MKNIFSDKNSSTRKILQIIYPLIFLFYFIFLFTSITFKVFNVQSRCQGKSILTLMASQLHLCSDMMLTFTRSFSFGVLRTFLTVRKIFFKACTENKQLTHTHTHVLRVVDIDQSEKWELNMKWGQLEVKLQLLQNCCSLVQNRTLHPLLNECTGHRLAPSDICPRSGRPSHTFHVSYLSGVWSSASNKLPVGH